MNFQRKLKNVSVFIQLITLTFTWRKKIGYLIINVTE